MNRNCAFQVDYCSVYSLSPTQVLYKPGSAENEQIFPQWPYLFLRQSESASRSNTVTVIVLFVISGYLAKNSCFSQMIL